MRSWCSREIATNCVLFQTEKMLHSDSKRQSNHKANSLDARRILADEDKKDFHHEAGTRMVPSKKPRLDCSEAQEYKARESIKKISLDLWIISMDDFGPKDSM